MRKNNVLARNFQIQVNGDLSVRYLSRSKIQHINCANKMDYYYYY